MSKPAEIQEALSISPANWAKHIGEGVVTKQKPNEYDIATVAREVLRYKDMVYRKTVGDRNSYKAKLKKAQEEIIQLNAKLSGELNADGEIVESVDSQKRKVDIELVKRRIRKMDIDEAVRAKTLIPIELLTDIVAQLAGELSGGLDPLVNKVHQMMPEMTASTKQMLLKEFAKTRNSLARYESNKVTNEFLAKFDPEGSISSTDTASDT